MKRPGRVLGSLLAMVLAVLTLQAFAADGQMAGRNFDHTATGFPLVGGHATAVCETCHVAGVFKGTPRNCDGCHAVGKRVIATPKSTSHIVTDAPCDTCHFNTSTWVGARYNHGTAQPGQCANCHNGRITTGRPANHNAGVMLTGSCDNCHRTYAFLPASWNHVGVTPGSCDNAGCHVQGSNQYYRSTSTHARTYMRTNKCDDCHRFVSWTPRHMVQTKPCSGCHNGVDAIGKGPTHGTTSAECSTCHTNTTTWLGASYHNGAVAGICGTCHNGTTAKGTVNDPNGTHIPLLAGGNPNCDLCHTSTTTFTAFAMNHSGNTTCNTCHASTSTYAVNTKRVLGSHQGSTAAQDCSNCHSSTATWAGAMGAAPTNHIPYNAGVSCGQCHTGGQPRCMAPPCTHISPAFPEGAQLATLDPVTLPIRGASKPRAAMTAVQAATAPGAMSTRLQLVS